VISPVPLDDDAGSIVERLAERGPDAELLSRLAGTVALEGRPRLVAGLYALAAEYGGSVLDAANAAVAAAWPVPFRAAIAALTALPAPVAATHRVRAALAGTYLEMGLPALAVEAYGDAATLPRDDRTDRRRAWWRSGGPLRFARRRRAARDRAALAAWPVRDVVPVERPGFAVLLDRLRRVLAADRARQALQDRVAGLLDDRRYDEAADVLTEALATAEPEPRLLASLWRLLAEVEEGRGRQEARLRHLAAAVAADPESLDPADDHLMALSGLGRLRAALDAAEALPERLRYHYDIRATVAQVYLDMGLPARAVQAAVRPPIRVWRAHPDGRAWWRSDRRWAWWRSGGPLPLLRRRFMARDARVVNTWQAWSVELARFDALDWPAGFEAAGIRAAVDGYLLRWAWLDRRRSVVSWWVRWLLHAVLGLSTVLAVSLAARGAGLPVGAAVLAGLGGTAGVYVLVRAVFLRWRRTGSTRLLLARGVPTCLALAAAGYGLLRLGSGATAAGVALPAGGAAIAGVALIAGAVGAAAYYLVDQVVWTVLRAGILGYHRRYTRESIIDDLLMLLDGTADAGARNDLNRRDVWLQLLENAALSVERDLPKRLGFGDAETAAWAAERARGAAAAMRRLKRYVVAPYPGSWERLTDTVRRQAVAVATGDLGTLRWVAPPTPAQVRRSRWRTALLVARAVALAVVPLAVVLVVSPFLGLTGSTVLWARIAGLGWAVLYLLLTADPGLRDKIETTRSLLTTVRDTGRRE
jgi:tetratricopeptide (TPR) repeat protein